MSDSHQPAPVGSISRSEQQPEARAANIRAARAIAETVRTSLGPAGRDKMLIEDGTVIVTNDGSSILHHVDVTHPAASLLVRAAASQEDGPGDGTSSTVLLAGELLANAESLFEQGLHPTTVIDGYRLGLEHALGALDEIGTPVDGQDRALLSNLAATTMTGRWDADRVEFLADLSVATALAATRNGRVDLDRVALQTVPGGSVTDSTLVEGVAIDLDTSSTNVASFEPAREHRSHSTVALIDGELRVRTGDSVTTAAVETAAELDAIRQGEEAAVAEILDTLDRAGVEVVYCQKQAADRVASRLGRAGILVVERTRQDEFDALETVTGAERVLAAEDVDQSVLGQAGAVERAEIGGEEFITVTGENGDAHTLILRAGTEHVLDELKRIFDDSLSVLATAIERGQVVPGGGGTEAWLAGAVRSQATGVGGKPQLAMEQFADALEALPKTLAANAGRNPIDIMTALRAAQVESGPEIGFHTDAGVSNVVEQGLLEPAELKRRLLTNAVEAATVILRVDDVIASTKQPEESADDSDGTPALHQDEGGYPWAVGH